MPESIHSQNPSVYLLTSPDQTTGKEFYSKTSGYNGLSRDAPPVKKDATLWVASCTKLLASICALQCVERGLVTIEEPVEKWLPELKDLDILSMTDENDPKTLKSEKSKAKITLRHLLTHTSGLGYEFMGMNPTYRVWREESGVKQVSGSVVQYYNAPLLFEPGTSWMYGPGIDWAGVLVERLNNNTPLGEYMKENIWAKLGNGAGKSSTFRLNSPEAKDANIEQRLLTNMLRQEDGSFIEQRYDFDTNVTEDSGGAGLYTTVADYTAALVDLISPSPKLLSISSIEKYLFAPHVTAPAALRAIIKARTNMTPDDPEASKSFDPSDAGVNHALAGMLWLKDGEVLPAGTLTWGGLPNLKWFVNREKGVAAMFAAQVTPAGDPKMQELAAEYFREVWKMVEGGEGGKGE